MNVMISDEYGTVESQTSVCKFKEIDITEFPHKQILCLLIIIVQRAQLICFIFVAGL